ncbi:MAG TPA: hypothetical protein ACQGQX_06390 [Xylella taiwanensis]
MPFINEIPSAEDIEKYGLLHLYKKNEILPIEIRRQWTVDHERNFYLCGIGQRGSQASDEPVYYQFQLYLNGPKFIVELDRDYGPSTFNDNPYVVRWDTIVSINAVSNPMKPLVSLPHSAWKNSDEPQPVLDNYSLNEFITILKEALTTRGAGESNRHIHHPIVVQFGF